METRAEFHFSWVYAFSATLSSLRKWANNDKYRLRPSTPAQLCWSSSRMQPLPNYNLIKFALIRPSTLNHDSNLWNFWGALDGRTCFCKFFSVPQRLNFIFAWICWMFVPTNSRSLSLSLCYDYAHTWDLHHRRASYFPATSGKNLLEESFAHHQALLQSFLWKLYCTILFPEINLMVFAINNNIMCIVQIKVNCLPLQQFEFLN